ncbi:MAG: hypothetical protein HY707_00820 [Ignavibacteriae bacterium]|nr:hypothetical protein [Ignavibacteriota bacterium]
MNPKPDKKIPALYGGIIMGLISAIPFVNIINCLCCTGILLGGFLAVMFYKNNFTPGTPPFTAGDCLAVGALAGIVGAVVDTVLSLMFLAIFGDVTQQYILDLIRNMDIQVPEEFYELFEEAMRQEMAGFAIIMNFFFALILDVLFGLLGGLIGYSVFKPKGQQPLQPSPPPFMPQAS